jgi:hypothetical protein
VRKVETVRQMHPTHSNAAEIGEAHLARRGLLPHVVPTGDERHLMGRNTIVQMALDELNRKLLWPAPT